MNKPSSSQIVLYVVGFVFVFWLAFLAWTISSSGHWLSFPVIAFLILAALRIVYELTLNRAHVPTMASGFMARQKIAKVLQKEAAAKGKTPFSVIDLGSGGGELARAIAKTIPEADVLGIELNRFPVFRATFLQRLFGPKNLRFKRSDFLKLDCSSFDAAVLYLGAQTAQDAGEKLRREMAAGSMVISHGFPLKGSWMPTETVQFHTPFSECFYVYRKE
jgi:SAM-dependent methyltransferase